MASEDENASESKKPPLNGSLREHRAAHRVEKSPSTGFGTLASSYRDVGPYLGLGIQLAATIVICFFIGRWLDGLFNTTPWLMVLGAIFGAAAGLYNFIKTVIQLGKKQKENREKKSGE
jgi:ATP synthase protein I